MMNSEIEITQSQEVMMFARTLRHLQLANVAVEVIEGKKYTLIVIRMNDN